MNTFDAINGAIRQQFHLNAFQVSTLETLYFAADVLFLIPAGLLLDRFSTRKLLLSVFIVMIISTIVFSMAQSYWLMAVCRFIIGAMASFCLLVPLRLTSRWFASQYGGLIMGIVVTVAMLGGMFAQQILKLDALFGTWHHTLIAISIFGIALWILNFIFVKDVPAGAQQAEAQAHDTLKDIGFWHSLGQAAKNTQNWIAGIYTNILCIPVVVLGALWGQDYLVGAKNVSHSAAANIVSLIFLGMIFGSPISGWISDKLKRRKAPMIVGAILSLLVVILIYVAHTNNVTYLSVLFFLLGFFPGTQVLSYPYFIEVNPRHITATSASLGSLIIMSCGYVFGLLFGWVTNQNATVLHGDYVYNATSYNHAFLILPITFACSVVLACCLKETRCQSIQ